MKFETGMNKQNKVNTTKNFNVTLALYNDTGYFSRFSFFIPKSELSQIFFQQKIITQKFR